MLLFFSFSSHGNNKNMYAKHGERGGIFISSIMDQKKESTTKIIRPKYCIPPSASGEVSPAPVSGNELAV